MPSNAQRRSRGASAIRSALLIATLLAAVDASAAQTPAAAPAHTGSAAKRIAKLPADARAVADRLAMCTHFMGEFNGDRSERDREVNATLTELRCERIDADVDAIRKKYPRNAAVAKALEDATAL